MGPHSAPDILRQAVAEGAQSAARAAGTVQEALDTSLLRGGAAWDAVRGARVGPPTAVRRWPWALGAAVLGAVVGSAVAVLARRVGGQDAPGAQEPDELEAVVDRPERPPPG